MAADRHTWSHQAAFEATPASASRARSFVVRHLVDHGLRYLVEPVRLVASELAFAHPDLSEELRLVNLELRAGKARSEALHNLAARTEGTSGSAVTHT